MRTAPRHHLRRRGFTLVELLIAVTILLFLLAAISVVVFRLGSGRKVSDTALTVQGMLISARDRALSRKIPIGVRIVPEDNNPEAAKTLIYVRSGQPISLGTVRVVESVPGSNVFDRVLLIGASPNQFTILPQVINPQGVPAGTYYYGSIRFGKAGAIYDFVTTDAFLGLTGAPPATVIDGVNFNSQPFLVLLQPFTHRIPAGAGITATTGNQLDAINSLGALAGTTGDVAGRIDFTGFGIEYEVPAASMPSVPIEDVEPIRLPAGVQIDIGYFPTSVVGSRNPNTPFSTEQLTRITRSGSGYFEIMFSPNGQVIGPAARDSVLGIWLREETAQMDIDGGDLNLPAAQRIPRRVVRISNSARHLIVGVYSQSGMVTTLEPVFAPTVPAGQFFDFNRYYDNAARAAGSGL